MIPDVYAIQGNVDSIVDSALKVARDAIVSALKMKDTLNESL